MSYSSRVYRQRNPKTKDESKEQPFFSKKEQKGQKKNGFFQAKLAVNEPGDPSEKQADSVADAAVQRLATTHEEEIDSSNDSRMERDKEKPFQRKAAVPEKEKEKELPVHKKEDPTKEKEKAVQKKEDPTKEKEKMVSKKEEPMKDKEKDKAVQKKEDCQEKNKEKTDKK